MNKTTPTKNAQKQDEAKKKQERLAEELRANLRRRKSQSRVRKDTPKDQSE